MWTETIDSIEKILSVQTLRQMNSSEWNVDNFMPQPTVESAE